MTEPLIVVGPSGAVIETRRPTVGLLGATALPGGGMVSVDLFWPQFAYALVMTAEQMGDATFSAVAERLADSASLGSGRGDALPEAWIRLALVTGVDRWSLTELDEGLLSADRALALERAGDPASAAELFRAAEISLGRLVDRLLGSDLACPVATRNELRDLLGAAARYSEGLTRIRDDARELSVLRSPTLTTVPWPVEDYESRAPAHPDRSDVDHFVPDPLHVPARLLRTPAQVTAGPDGLIEVRCPAFPGVDAGHPALERLLIRVVERFSGELLAVGAFEFSSVTREFSATLRLPRKDSADIYIDIYDVLSAGSARYSDQDRPDIAALSTAQSTFTLMRDRTALEALGNSLGAETALRFARLAVGELTGHGSEIAAALGGTSDDAAPGSTGLVGSAPELRPLLCELAVRTP